jgi:CHAD domain-containing protein
MLVRFSDMNVSANRTIKKREGKLLQGDGHKAEKAATIDIPPDMTAGDAFRAIALSCLRQIMANEPSMCTGQTESLHQMRIGLRRLRAAIAIFADVVADENLAKIKTELKWITHELGPARDLDVFNADVLNPLRASHPGDKAVAAVYGDLQQQRMAAYARAAAAARSSRFRAAALDFAEWIETGSWAVDDDKDRTALRTRPVAQHAKKKLARIREWIKRKGNDLRDQSASRRHHVRVRAKRLRYATEFFAALFPRRRTRAYRAALARLQVKLPPAVGLLNKYLPVTQSHLLGVIA